VEPDYFIIINFSGDKRYVILYKLLNNRANDMPSFKNWTWMDNCKSSSQGFNQNLPSIFMRSKLFIMNFRHLEELLELTNPIMKPRKMEKIIRPLG
jgi:hypothetical protein